MPVPTVQLPDGSTKCLGRIRPKARPVALRFSAYFFPAAMTVPPPALVDYHTKAAESIKRVYLNDRLGDCVIAGKYHSVGMWTAADSGAAVVGTDQEVQAMYRTICGPGDNGCNITEVLDYFKSTGLPFGGVNHKIDAYVAIDWTNKLETQVAMFLFGPLTCGVNLPSGWTSGPWSVANAGRIVGGHDVPTAGYDENGVKISTWGEIRDCEWAAWQSRNWFEEVYAILSPDWYGNDNLAPCGVDTTTLRADLEKLGGGSIPPLTPPVIDWTP